MAELTPTPSYTGALRALESTDYAVPGLWNELHQVLLDQDAWLRARVLALADGSELQPGSVSDVHLGLRSVTPVAPVSDSNTLTGLLNNLVERVRAVTGASTWRDAPATTLAAARAHADAFNAHGATSAATPNRPILRDAHGRAKVAAPVAPDDIARLADLDAVTGGLGSHLGAGGDAHALATPSAHGFMSAGDKAKLNAYPSGVAAGPTASTAMVRDGAGRAQVAAPVSQADIARLAEVAAVSAALATHASQGGDAHPLATSSVAGFMSAADKFKLDMATSNFAINRLVMSDSEGRLRTGPPAAANHAVNLSYLQNNTVSSAQLASALGDYYTRAEVDGKLAGKANASHSHSWTSITGRPSSFPPSAHTHSANDITLGQLAVARLPQVSDAQAWVLDALGRPRTSPQIGEYIMASATSGQANPNSSSGGVTDGSSLRYSNANNDTHGGGPAAGTKWRCMGFSVSSRATLWLRIA